MLSVGNDHAVGIGGSTEIVTTAISPKSMNTVYFKNIWQGA
jgi:hypothetical protein